MVKLEVGKYYKTRDGRKVGPLRRYEGSSCYWDVTDDVGSDQAGFLWASSGRYLNDPDLDIVSEWVDYSSCKAAQIDVQREEYGTDPWRDGTHYKAGPIRHVTETTTRREIAPGRYGAVDVGKRVKSLVAIRIANRNGELRNTTAEELREAAHLFNQLAEVLEDA